MAPYTAVVARPSPVPARKRACYNCRTRKKKCDGKLPVCSGCIKSKAQCVYKPTKSDYAVNGGQAHLLEYASTWSGTNDMADAQAFQPTQMAMPNHMDYIDGSTGTGSKLYTPAGVLPSPGLDRDQFIDRPFHPPIPISMGEHGSDSSGTVSQAQISAADRSSSRSTPNFGPELAFSGNGSSSSYIPRDLFGRLQDVTEFRDQTSPEGSTRQLSPADSQQLLKAEDVDIFPSITEVLELLDIFFARYHFYLPCIHQKTFMDRVKRGRESIQSYPLIWALMAVAGSSHSDPRLQGLCGKWLARARSIFDKNLHSSTSPTQSLQAAVWIIFHYYVEANLTEAWFFLGKTTRLANLMGVDRVDSCRTDRFITMVLQPRDSIEMEEQRKTMWALFFFDRALSSLVALSLSFDERIFQVNFPIDDNVFQAAAGSENLPQSDQDPMTTDLMFVICRSVMQDFSSKPSINHIYRASVLLGRIMSLHSQPSKTHGSKDFSTEFAKLDNAMSLIGFALSRGQQDSRGITSIEASYQIWLSTLVQKCNILLYHPITFSSSPDLLNQMGGMQDNSGFERCMDAVRQNVCSIKQAASGNLESVINPFLVTTYFLCCRFLCISWHEHKRQAEYDEIESILMLIDRLGEKWAPLAKKFRKGIMRDLRKSPDDVRRMRVGTGCYVDIECA